MRLFNSRASLFVRLSLIILSLFSASALAKTADFTKTATFAKTATVTKNSDFDIPTLANQSYWLKLGHYLPNTLSGYESTIDSEDFFLAANGKTHPKQELAATINALYHADASVAKAARCQYPARFTWLESKAGRTAQLDCPELERWQKVLDPDGMTLVFPTAFMNNPSSMFGHTLLRIDAQDQTRNKELVAFAVNFAAEPSQDDNAALYAAKGLFGAYPGQFTVMPYYRKVREYNDIESRDIWEYPLNLSEQEVNRVLLHLWEMQSATFDYYFLDENCSYQLLALLQLARNDLNLVDDFPFQAIPSDTVKTLANHDLIKTPNFRASFGTRLLNMSQQASHTVFDAAQKAKNGDFPDHQQYTDEQLAAIYEFAYEWLNFDFYDQALPRDPYAQRLTQLLALRSQIDAASPFEPVKNTNIAPDKGHGSTRIGIGARAAKYRSDALTFAWRAAYHDLLDPQDGFVPGAQISFVDVAVSHDEDGHTQLDKLYLIDAMTIAPKKPVFSSLSWNVRAGFDRQSTTDKQEGRWFAQGGMGQSWGDSNGLHAYALWSTSLSHGAASDDQFNLATGLESGLLWQLADDHRLGVQAQYLPLLNRSSLTQSQVI
ncbi:DUF4105 domain-containing protein [Salinivibrio socompensis]|uniref:Lnb N-terminal periplasmic domain-containing protein n=1 Tax=Salinivibrio socompensis TaxID=1510206 RepID=UPI001F0A7CC8|nr:DUF4105 domain-containing protein [Salinivibrio socompensis]